MAESISILDILNPYATLINTFLTFITIMVSLFSIYLTNRNAKKEREVVREEEIKQRKRYEEEKKRLQEIERLREQPYLVFKEAKISSESDGENTRLDMLFINKGRGAAYEMVPCLECKAKTSQGEALLRRCEPIQDPIAMVGEKFKTVWTLGYRVELIDFMVTISIKYSDTSGRNYIQKFDIIFHKIGHADITNYAQPELSEE